ncbi:hypothetical protein ACDH52_20295, partial [Xanthomonas fragariae]
RCIGAPRAGERLHEYCRALAMDLIHLATADRSLLPSELWDAASGVGDDAYVLVDGLLSAARSRASAEASASSSS